MTLSSSANAFWKRPRAVLTMVGLTLSLALLAATLIVLSAAVVPNSGALFGISAAWLILGGVGLLISAGLAGFALKAWRDPRWAEALWIKAAATKWIRWLSALGFALGGILVCLPAYRFRELQIYFIRLYPFIVWFALWSGLTLLLSLLAEFEFQPLSAKQALHSRRQALWIAFVVFAFSLGLWALYTWGLPTRYEEYAYGAGVPVLGGQILLALAAALGFYYIEQKGLLLRFKHADLWIGLVLWSVTAALWVNQPAPPTYFNPGPYPPHQEYYPFSDAALFDTGSQYLLIGQGLNAGVPSERPLYMQALVFLHLAAGQNYEAVMNLQAALFAVFALFIYLIGRELAGRPLGIGLGVLAALRGVNSILGASLIDLSSPKQMLTDFPTAVGLALLLYLTIQWLKRPREKRLFVFWAGGLIGLLSLTRTNALLMILPLVLLVWIVYRRKLRAVFGLGFVLFAMVLVSIYPWGVSSQRSIFDVYYIKFRNVLDQRYHFQLPLPDAVTPAGASRLSAPIRYQPPAAESLGAGFIAQGLYHNLLTSFLSLPASPQLHELRYTVKKAFPFWNNNWDGNFDMAESLFLLLQLGILSFGVGMAWKRANLAGLAPLLFFLTYQFSNTLGRTSGGRYIVPVDWVALVYYLFGCLELVYFVLDVFSQHVRADEAAHLPADDFKWAAAYHLKITGILAAFVFIGLAPTLTGALFPLRYTVERKASDLARLQAAGYFQAAGISSAQLKTFLGQPSAALAYGRALYPRLYAADKGERDGAYPYLTLPFPRLAFRLINSDGNRGILFPATKIPYFPNASDAFVLGCVSPTPDAHLDALVVFLLDADGQVTVYTRQPAAPLQCPAPPVVCDQHNECRSLP